MNVGHNQLCTHCQTFWYECCTVRSLHNPQPPSPAIFLQKILIKLVDMLVVAGQITVELRLLY